MFVRLLVVVAAVLLVVAVVQAQQPATQNAPTTPGTTTPSMRWRSPTGEIRPATTATTTTSGAAASRGGLVSVPGAPRAPVAKVTAGTGALPNQDGQVWREYDISPYTARVTSTNRPEQAIVDWVLRETGYETWHSNVVSVLAADGRALRAYHTPEVQAVVADVVDRFVAGEAQTQQVGVRIVSLGSPNWRVRAQPMLRPVPVQTQGIQAWLMAREDASLLAAELRKRSDFREHGSPQLFIVSGQSAVVSLMRPRQYVADVAMRNDVWPGYETKAAQYEEGMSLEISPLTSLDGRSLDAVLKVNIDQLERLQTIAVDVPSPVAPRQRADVGVPQVAQFRLHDRFRWPIEQVLVVSLGVVPLPTLSDPTIAGFRLPAPLVGGAPRGELLVFIENRAGGTTSPTTPTGTTPTGTTPAASATPAPLPGISIPTTVGGLPNVPLTPSRARY